MSDEPRPQQVKIATIWEVVEGEHMGRYLIEPKTEDDLPEVLLRINIASADALYRLFNMLRSEESEGGEEADQG
jgi:hypothetical protein